MHTPSAPTNLWRAAEAFVGRHGELEACVSALMSGARVVTVTGPGGVGKTRLVNELLARIDNQTITRDSLDVESIVRCELSAAASHADVIASVASALGLALTSDAEADTNSDRISYALSARGKALLVLDNAEHILEVVSSLLRSWLAHASSVRALVTSQEPLALATEYTLRIGPLPLPAALELFAARATAHGRTLDLESAPLVTEIVGAVDHLPLGIELAAAWVQLLPLAELRDRLAADLSMLRNRRRDADPRHASLQAAIEGAWHRLASWERDALAQCTVFRGVFSVAAAEQVVSLEAGAPSVVMVIATLCQHSLLSVGTSEKPVVRMLNSVRSFASARLAEQPEVATSAMLRHRHYARAAAEGLVTQLHRAGRAAALRQFEFLLPDLVVAFERASSEGAADSGALAIAIDPLLAARGPAALHQSMLNTAVNLSTGLIRARLLTARVRVRAAIGDGVGADSDSKVALALAEETGDPVAQIEACLAAAAHHIVQRRFDEAAEISARAAALAEAHHQVRYQGLAVARVAFARSINGSERAALAHFDHALLLHEAAHDATEIPRTLAARGVCRFKYGDVAGARADLERAVELSPAVGDRPAEVEILRFLAFVLAETGELEAASARLEHCLAIATELALMPELAILTNNVGVIAMEQNYFEVAEAHFHRAAALSRQIGLAHRTALAIGNLGILNILRGDLVRGSALLDEAMSLVAAHANWPVRWIFLGHLAAAATLQGNVAAAERYTAACAGAPAMAQPVLEVLARAHALERANQALLAQDLAAAWAALATARTPKPAEAIPSADMRLAVAAIARARHDIERRASLRLDPDLRTLGIAASPPIDLERRPVLRAILRTLLAGRQANPGQPISVDDLVAATWPGDRSQKASLVGRLRVAIGELRRLGIGDAVRTQAGGYLLDVNVPVIIER